MTDDHALRTRLAAQAQTITALNELLHDMREVNRTMNHNLILLRAALIAERRFRHVDTCTCRGCADTELLISLTEGT
jgi:uncharacterized coiled-coil protein SlyX